MRERRISILFLGCGFLASHLIPHILPFADHIILVDKERVERANYENAILPKAYVGKRKVSATATLIQILSSTKTTLHHTEIKNTDQLLKLHEKHKPDFCFVTFDNIKARKIAKEYATKTKTPTLFVGVTANHVYIDWAENIALPDGEELVKVEQELREIRDVCTRIQFRGLGLLATTLAYYAFIKWLWEKEKTAYLAHINKENIHIATIKRN